MLIKKKEQVQKIECVECGKELKGKYKEIGINQETGDYTFDDKKATQGFFPIGLYCFKQIKNGRRKKDR